MPIAVGGTYFARVRAVNTYGTIVTSGSLGQRGAPNPRPGTPTSLTAFFTGSTIAIEWTAPTTCDPVTTYLLEVGSAPGLANLLVVPMGAGLSFTAPGVPDGTFWLRVRGTNAAGVGVPSQDLGVVMGVAGGCVGLPYAPCFARNSRRPASMWWRRAGRTSPGDFALCARVRAGLYYYRAVPSEGQPRVGVAARSIAGAT